MQGRLCDLMETDDDRDRCLQSPWWHLSPVKSLDILRYSPSLPSQTMLTAISMSAVATNGVVPSGGHASPNHDIQRPGSRVRWEFFSTSEKLSLWIINIIGATEILLVCLLTHFYYPFAQSFKFVCS